MTGITVAAMSGTSVTSTPSTMAAWAREAQAPSHATSRTRSLCSARRERLLSSADLLRRCGKDGGLARKVVALAESLAGNPLPHHLHPFLRGLAAESVESARAVLARDQQLPAVPSI